MVLSTTPKQDNFRMPAEFEPQTCIYMLWPERGDVWHHNAEEACKAFSEVANAIAQFVPVVVGVSSSEYMARAQELLKEGVKIIVLPHDDAWARDVGPTFVINDRGELRGIDWKFNAWGGITQGAYYPWDTDDKVAQRIIEYANVKRYRTEEFILEGGSIHVDGEGTLLTTKQCLLNPNRNPHLSQEQIETYLREYLNISKIIWLDNGLYNDETDGHIDNIACFARPSEVILSWTDDPNSPNYSICRDAMAVLENSTDAKGRKLTVHKLHLPQPVYITEEEYSGIIKSETTRRSTPNEPLPASYVNFLICNDGIVMPVFNDPMDKLAIETLQSIFPQKKIVPVYSREIILGGGNIHCITQQQPKV